MRVSVTVSWEPFAQPIWPDLIVQHCAGLLPLAAQFWSVMSFFTPWLSVRCSTTEQIGWPAEFFWIVPVMQGGAISWPSLVAMAVIELA